MIFGALSAAARASGSTLVEPVVIVVDDDELMRSALRRLFASSKLSAEFYASGAEFLAQARLDSSSCIILDLCMPGMSGLEVQSCLKQRRPEIPLIFLTGSSDVPIAVSAMREGAVDFIEKPFDNDDLLVRVRRAIDLHRLVRQEDIEQRHVQRRLESLTAREYSVFDLLVTGKTNKEIARILGPSHRTIEVHRSRIMEKMAVSTLADLVRAQLLRAGVARPGRGK
jgi:FixJ family two-component response regulator